MTNDESESCAISNYKSKILASTLAFVIISAISISLLPIRTSNASCATYNAASNTISITCDSTMPQVSSDVNNESVLKNLGGGEWLLKAILQINDGAKLTISSPEVSWLKIEGSNGIVVYGRIDITG